jgi:hypothetical protein
MVMVFFRRKKQVPRPERAREVIELPFWRCIPCGATNSSAFCYLCGRRREDATDHSRWDRFFTVDAVIAPAPTVCPDCGDEVEEPFTLHTGCCPHTNVDLAMDAWDPARERKDAGTCADCGAGVYLEHDEDTVYWEVMR